MRTKASIREAAVERAGGVLAERFGVAIATSERVLPDVAHAQRCDVPELADAVVASYTTDSTPLPRRLYADSKGAA